MDIRTSTRPATGANLVARLGPAPRVVVTAHIDSALGTPGALDNAAGVASMVALAEQLGQRPPDVGVELAVLNGEDHWHIPGQRRYLTTLDRSDVELAVNIDGVGRRGDSTCWCGFGLGALESLVGTTFEAAGIAEGPPWYSGDHAMFVTLDVPTVALTSRSFLDDPASTITHTAADDVAQVDMSALVGVARTVERLIRAL